MPFPRTKHYRCVMGCNNSRSRHRFPNDPKRRAEWCRIIGIYPRANLAFLCDAHFSDCYKFGNRLSKFAIPNPPESRNVNSQNTINNTSMSHRKPNYQVGENAKYDCNSISTETVPTHDEIINEELEDEKEELAGEKEESETTFGKVENFEIRKRSTNGTIIKGRFVQTNDYLLVSYTPPRKWTLQQQLKILDDKCIRQSKQITQLNKQNKELKKYEKLLPKVRYLQKYIRFLRAQLKMFKTEFKKIKKQTRLRKPT